MRRLPQEPPLEADEPASSNDCQRGAAHLVWDVAGDRVGLGDLALELAATPQFGETHSHLIA